MPETFTVELGVTIRPGTALSRATHFAGSDKCTAPSFQICGNFPLLAGAVAELGEPLQRLSVPSTTWRSARSRRRARSGWWPPCRAAAARPISPLGEFVGRRSGRRVPSGQERVFEPGRVYRALLLPAVAERDHRDRGDEHAAAAFAPEHAERSPPRLPVPQTRSPSLLAPRPVFSDIDFAPRHVQFTFEVSECPLEVPERVETYVGCGWAPSPFRVRDGFDERRFTSNEGRSYLWELPIPLALEAAAARCGRLSVSPAAGGDRTLRLWKLDPGAVDRLACCLPQGSLPPRRTARRRRRRWSRRSAPARPHRAQQLGARTSLRGRLHPLALPTPATPQLGVFEVDEAALSEIARRVRPKALLLGNLFRDQLDRYGRRRRCSVARRRGPAGRVQLVVNGDHPPRRATWRKLMAPHVLRSRRSMARAAGAAARRRLEVLPLLRCYQYAAAYARSSRRLPVPQLLVYARPARRRGSDARSSHRARTERPSRSPPRKVRRASRASDAGLRTLHRCRRRRRR